MRRRDFLSLTAQGAAAMALPGMSLAQQASVRRRTPIIDVHIHLFDPSRPGGVPWPLKDDTVLYKPALPERYEAVTAGLGVVGAIAIEASPLASDNDWLLKVAAQHPVIVGVVGDLIPGAPSFLKDLDRLHADPLFRGFRYGNLWDRDLAVDLDKPGFVDGLKALQQAGLVFESANPDPSLVRAILRVAESVPGLTIVVDHLPHAPVPLEAKARDEYWANVHRLGEHPRVFIKLSEIPVSTNGRLNADIGTYQAGLDALWGAFGEDRVLFGSDWPNSDHVASYDDTLAIAYEYLAEKTAAVREKFFWKNSIKAYKWHKRRPEEPALLEHSR